MWQDRAQNGPFRVAGDFSTNSPGHWTEIAAAAAADWASGRWDGPPNLDGDGAVAATVSGNDAPNEAFRTTSDIYAGAIFAVTMNRSDIANKVMTELVWHAGRSRLNFANQTTWPRDGRYNDNAVLFNTSGLWMADLMMAYELVRTVIGPNSTVINWMEQFGLLVAANLNVSLQNQFPNRLQHSWTSRASWINQDVRSPYVTAAGVAMPQPRINQWYNNRRIYQGGAIAIAAAMTGNPTLRNHATVFAKEWVMFGNRYDGLNGYAGDANRGSDTFPQRGLAYEFQSLNAILVGVDMLARSGDTEIYDFSSSEGAATPEGGSNHYKSFEDVLDSKIKWVAQTWPAAYRGRAGVADDRIISRNTRTGNEIVSEGYILSAAAYFGRTDWHDAIMRLGTPTQFTSNVTPSGPVSGWRVDGRYRFLRSFDASPWS